jgi:hypothetical protein
MFHSVGIRRTLLTAFDFMVNLVEVETSKWVFKKITTTTQEIVNF